MSLIVLWKSFKLINELESNGEKLVPPSSKESYLLQFSNIPNTLDLSTTRKAFCLMRTCKVNILNNRFIFRFLQAKKRNATYEFTCILSRSYRIDAEENSRGWYGYGGQEKG